MGSVYKRGKIYWIRYSRFGKDYYESSKSKKKKEAKDLLKEREGALAGGADPVSLSSKATFDELAKDLLNDYIVNQRKCLQRVGISIKHLRKFFGGCKANQITTALIRRYIQKRLNEGANNGTVNREIRALSRMLKLGYQDSKIARIPYVPTLKEGPPRTGFFEHEEYLDLLKALPAFLRPVATFAYRTGWRKSEILGLTWDRVNFKEKTVELRAGTTKNDAGRLIYLDDELLTLLKGQRLRRHKGCSCVFHRDGKQIKDFRGTWKRACKKAGLSGKLFHDFRRTAVRNLVRSGTPETVAMKITGHKTRSVFERYNITSEEDLKLAAQRQNDYLKNRGVTKPLQFEGKSEVQQGTGQKKGKAQVVNISK